MSLVNPLFEHEGQIFDLTVIAVARLAQRSATWVHLNAAALGGVRRRWDPHHETWRFPSEGIDERIFDTTGRTRI